MDGGLLVRPPAGESLFSLFGIRPVGPRAVRLEAVLAAEELSLLPRAMVLYGEWVAMEAEEVVSVLVCVFAAAMNSGKIVCGCCMSCV